eukprot:10693856-Lingulodinium_polyedra.AAC.1
MQHVLKVAKPESEARKVLMEHWSTTDMAKARRLIMGRQVVQAFKSVYRKIEISFHPTIDNT